MDEAVFTSSLRTLQKHREGVPCEIYDCQNHLL